MKGLPGGSRTLAGTRRGAGWLLLLAPFFYASYGLANHLAAARAEVPSLVYGWEQHVPFVAWTILPYWSLNLLYGLSMLSARTPHEADRHALRLLTAQVIAVACFIAWPLRCTFGRPEADGLPGLLFDALRGFDQPYNQAPSLHVALAVLVFDMLRRRLAHRPARVALGAWMVLIVVSVLTTWQHHAIDIPTGALLGVFAAWAWPLQRQASMLQVLRRALASAPHAARDLPGTPTNAARLAPFPCEGVRSAPSPCEGGGLGWGSARRTLPLRYTAGSLVAAGAAIALDPVTWGLPAAWLALSLILVALNYLALGPRGFQMDGHGRMAWPARVLFAPYRAAAWLNARLWTRRWTPLREVVPGVSVGSLVHVRRLAPRARVVSLAAELQVPAALRGRAVPGLDLVPASPRALRRAAAAIDAAVQQGGPVVVACALGVSRSAAALGTWLVRRGLAVDADDAIAMLHRAQPAVVLHDGWRAAMREATARAGAAAAPPVVSRAAVVRPGVSLREGLVR